MKSALNNNNLSKNVACWSELFHDSKRNMLDCKEETNAFCLFGYFVLLGFFFHFIEKTSLNFGSFPENVVPMLQNPHCCLDFYTYISSFFEERTLFTQLAHSRHTIVALITQYGKL